MRRISLLCAASIAAVAHAEGLYNDDSPVQSLSSESDLPSAVNESQPFMLVEFYSAW